MKKKIGTLLFVITSALYAQKEIPNKTIAIPPRLDAGIKAESSATPTTPNRFVLQIIPPLKINLPSVFDLDSKKTNLIQIGDDKRLDMSVNASFANPGDVYERKINRVKDRADYNAFRKNQDLGTFTSKADRVRVMYRDHEYVDGDKIRVYINGKVVKLEVTLIESFQGFDHVLEPGFNKIEFEALNQGSSGLNTAEIRVYDDKGILISGDQWNLATGFKASIIVVKEVE